MAVGFRAISLTIWEKVNIKGERGKWHLSKEGSRGKEKVGDARFMQFIWKSFKKLNDMMA